MSRTPTKLPSNNDVLRDISTRRLARLRGVLRTKVVDGAVERREEDRLRCRKKIDPNSFDL